MLYYVYMETSILQSDIFFFVSTVGFIVLGLLLVIGLVYVIQILRTIKQISKTAQEGTQTIVDGIQEAKAKVGKDGFVTDSLISIFSKLYSKKRKK